MRAPIRFWVAVSVLLLPILIGVVWYVNNRGWLNDDAANYMATAYRQYEVLESV